MILTQFQDIIHLAGLPAVMHNDHSFCLGCDFFSNSFSSNIARIPIYLTEYRYSTSGYNDIRCCHKSKTWQNHFPRDNGNLKRHL